MKLYLVTQHGSETEYILAVCSSLNAVCKLFEIRRESLHEFDRGQWTDSTFEGRGIDYDAIWVTEMSLDQRVS